MLTVKSKLSSPPPPDWFLDIFFLVFNNLSNICLGVIFSFFSFLWFAEVFESVDCGLQLVLENSQSSSFYILPLPIFFLLLLRFQLCISKTFPCYTCVLCSFMYFLVFFWSVCFCLNISYCLVFHFANSVF